jgi:hypothetical protein
MCAAGPLPDPEESKYHAHALLKKAHTSAQLLDLLAGAELQWVDSAELPLAFSGILPLRPISQLRSQLDTASPPLSSDLILLTNSPPLSA